MTNNNSEIRGEQRSKYISQRLAGRERGIINSPHVINGLVKHERSKRRRNPEARIYKCINREVCRLLFVSYCESSE